MRPLALLLLLFISSPAPAAKELSAPAGLTLSVGADGVSRLSWEAIFDDTLMGYSVWKRFEGTGADFTRIQVPIKVGAEVKKLPMTTSTRYAFKDAKGKHSEFVVVAEYESGRSRPSPPAKTRLARLESPAPVTGTAEPVSATAAPLESRDVEPEPAPAPKRSPLAKPGQLRSYFRTEFTWDITESHGYGRLIDLGFTSSDVDAYAPLNWSSEQLRRSFRIPFGLEYGLFPGLQIAAEGTWADEATREQEFFVGGTPLKDTELFYRDLSTAGMANVWLSAKAKPFDEAPLIAGVEMSLPTGVSRLKSWAEYLFRLNSAAGNDSGVSRLRVSASWGDKWSEEGMHYFAGYSPSASETVAPFPSSPNFKYQGHHPDAVEAGGGYSFPYTLFEKPGVLVLGVTGRSISPGRLLFQGRDIGSSFDRYQRTILQNEGGLNLIKQDQLEISLEWEQAVHGLAASRGKFHYTAKPDGYMVGVGGGFVY